MCLNLNMNKGSGHNRAHKNTEKELGGHVAGGTMIDGLR